MEHYVCTGGCHGVSDQPKTCDGENCPKNGHPLIPCHCEDGEHKEVMESEEAN